MKVSNLLNDRGLTLLEVVVIMVVVAILASIAIVRFGFNQRNQIIVAAHQMVSDIAYAQELAMATGKGTQVVINRWQQGGGGGGGGGGCFVATVSFGTGSRVVAEMRGFRDQVLMGGEFGRAFVDWYYRDGPALAAVVASEPLYLWAARLVIAPVAMITAPFVDDAYALGWGRWWRRQRRPVPRGQPNTYEIKFQDGTAVQDPQGGGDFVVELEDPVRITSQNRVIYFDSRGRANVDNRNWPANQTSMIVCTLNNSVHIYMARLTGKVWVVVQ